MGVMWFGTRDYMQWVKCPAINYSASKSGWATTAKQLDGGTYVRRSVTSSKVYNLAWNLSSRDDLRPIMDYADGIYGLGPVYFIDPFTMDKNVLPQ